AVGVAMGNHLLQLRRPHARDAPGLGWRQPQQGPLGAVMDQARVQRRQVGDGPGVDSQLNRLAAELARRGGAGAQQSERCQQAWNGFVAGLASERETHPNPPGKRQRRKVSALPPRRGGATTLARSEAYREHALQVMPRERLEGDQGLGLANVGYLLQMLRDHLGQLLVGGNPQDRYQIETAADGIDFRDAVDFQQRLSDFVDAAPLGANQYDCCYHGCSLSSNHCAPSARSGPTAIS